MSKKVVFIDEENTGLGPFAATLFKKKSIEGHVNVSSDSRGTVVLFPEPVNRKLAQIAIGYGISLDHHAAVQLNNEDFEGDVLLLALDNSSKKRVFEINNGFSNIFTLKEFLGEAGDIKLPIGEPIEKYEIVCEMIDRLTSNLIEKLKDEEKEK